MQSIFDDADLGIQQHRCKQPSGGVDVVVVADAAAAVVPSHSAAKIKIKSLENPSLAKSRQPWLSCKSVWQFLYERAKLILKLQRDQICTLNLRYFCHTAARLISE